MAQQTLEEVTKEYIENLAMSVKSVREIGFIDGYNKAKEIMYSEEQVIELIQFLSMNEMFNGYGSVSKETASYFLEKFKKQ